MSNNVHGLTVKDEDGKTKAHPLYWVWHEKKKKYAMCENWRESVLDFVEWAEHCGWAKGDSVRRYEVAHPFSPENCYVHVRGTPLGQEKGVPS
jgi:hypothetical protein